MSLVYLPPCRRSEILPVRRPFDMAHVLYPEPMIQTRV